MLIEEGLGFPALFNEEIIIDSQKRKGISAEDAWKFGIIGCVEPATPGKEFNHTEAFRLNWAKLLELMLHAYPKFGNDQDEPDELMNELTHFFCQEVSKYSNDRGGRYQAGLYTVSAHGPMGEKTGALPDGRLAGVALSNALSSTQGADRSGPTALMRSVTKLDHRLFGNGMVLDIKFHPSFFATEHHRKALRHLVDTYFALGGMEVQFNVVDRKTLLDAQKYPERYQDLVVRVSGFSAYFNDLQTSIQDEIIARTEHFASIGQ